MMHHLSSSNMSQNLRIRTVIHARQDPVKEPKVALPAGSQAEACHKKLVRNASRAWVQRSVWVLLLVVVASSVREAFRVKRWAVQNKQQKSPIYTFPDANSPDAADGRPHFIFHVGPPKTGTTTLQYSLTDYIPALKQDNYQYLGQVMSDPGNMWNHTHGDILRVLKDRNCMRKVNLARVNDEDFPSCWVRFQRLLNEHRVGNQSVILSEENFSIKTIYLKGGMERAPVDWQALADVLEDQGWHPVIVIGYRRLFDIMPSAKQQWDRWTKKNLGLNCWPPEGRALQPLFPAVLEDPRLYDNYTSDVRREEDHIQWSYTDHLMKQMSPYFEVRMMNIHQDVSLRTNFLCHIIPNALHSCAQSRLDDSMHGEVVRNTEESLFFDALGYAAAERGLFNTTLYRRRDVALAIRQFQGEEEFPLHCPTRQDTQLLLERSLVKEEQLWPADWVATWKEDHVRTFEKSWKKFCWIDIEAVLK